MVSQFFDWIRQVVASWKFWIVVPPWDHAVRVRIGRNAVALLPGPHWRIPFIDEITLVNTRLRVGTVPPITLSADGGRSRVVSATIGYRIAEPLTAIMRFTQPEIAVLAFAQAQITRLLKAEECCKALHASFAGSGVEIEFVRYVEDVEVRTYRVLQNGYGISDSMHGSPAPSGSNMARY